MLGNRWPLCLCRPRKSYATEAAAAIIQFGFEELGLHRIDAWIEGPNEGSRRVVEKLGFTHEGTKRKSEFTGGEWVDQVLYGLLAAEWDRRR